MLDIWSVSTVAITPYAFASPLSHGTGFFVRSRKSNVYLVTNYHVAAGRHPDTNRPLDKDSHVPDRLLLAIYSGNADLTHRWRPLVIPLQVNGCDNWFVHPEFGRTFDVVAIPMPSLFTGIVAVGSDSWPPVAIHPGSDVTIIGFPQGLSGGGGFPIWKNGGVASEPDLMVDGADYFWIDSNTRSGMSGAPVLARRFGTYLNEQGGNAMTNTHVDRLLGIYAGRALDSPDVTLGRVWRLRGLNAIIDVADEKHTSSRNYLPTTLRHYWHNDMASIANKILKSGTDPAGGPLSMSDIIRVIVDNDQRFGLGIERVRLAAKTIAACDEAKKSSAGIEIEQPVAALILDALTQPMGWSMNPLFRMILADIEDLIAELNEIIHPK